MMLCCVVECFMFVLGDVFFHCFWVLCYLKQVQDKSQEVAFENVIV